MKIGISELKCRLWYDLTKQVLDYIMILEKEQPNKILLEFYPRFIQDLESKINYLKYARMVIICSRKYEDEHEANSLLKNVLYRIKIDKDAQLLLRIAIATNLLLTRNSSLKECEDSFNKLKDEIDNFPKLNILIYSEFYKAYALYLNRRGDYEQFYQYALQYLAHTPESSLLINEKIEWSTKIGMAILLGSTIYNISEFVEKKILKFLISTPYLWLHDLLQAMNNAKVSDFFKVLMIYKTQIEAVPEIQQNMSQIEVKMRILALLDLVFHYQKEDRTIPFETIAKTTELGKEDVELLLIRAMSLQLIKGKIDQVSSNVKITWMKPRVLGLRRIQMMRKKIDNWCGRVEKILENFQMKTEELSKA